MVCLQLLLGSAVFLFATEGTEDHREKREKIKRWPPSAVAILFWIPGQVRDDKEAWSG